MSHRMVNSPTIPPSQSLGTNSQSPLDDNSFGGDNGPYSTSYDFDKASIRPASIISQKSNASRDTFYEDAPDKAEWMEIDSGDAYDDLEKTENTVRNISQRLSLLNSVKAVNLAAVARTRYHAMSENGKSQDLTTLFHSIADARTSYTAVNYSHQSTSSQSTDPNLTSYSNRDSCGSSKTSSSSRSYHSLLYSELDRNSSRSSTGIDRQPLGSVPLFTRIISSREEKEEEKELEPIPEAPDLERAEEFFRMTSSPLSMGGSNRRRLKPLILRTTHSNPNSSRRRTSSAEPAPRNSLSSAFASPPQPIYETQSLLVLNCDTWDTSQKSSDDVTLKDSEVTSGTTESQASSPPRSTDGKNAPVVVDLDKRLQSNQAFQEAIDENSSIKFPNLGQPIKQVTEETNNDEIPVIKSSKQRSGTFGVHSTKPSWAVQSNPSVDIMPRESLLTLTIEDSTSFPPELQKNLPNTEHIQKSDHSIALKNSWKNLSPIKTQLLTSVRQPATSHHSVNTGTSEDISVVSASAQAESMSSFKNDSPVRYRKRCLSNLYMPKHVQNQDRGISAASYAAARRAERKNSHSSISSGSRTPDTLIITTPPALTRPPTDESRSESSGPQELDKEPREATLTSSARKSRLYMTLGRIQARDAKILDLTSLHVSSKDPALLIDAQDQARLIKGKLKRISKPILLEGEDERMALWGMISNGKLASNSHK